MNFIEAVRQMKEGKRVTRPCWAGYIYMTKHKRVCHRDGEFRNTAINDLEATDWEIDEYTFNTAFKKLADYASMEGLTHLADAMGKEVFWTRCKEQIDNSDIEKLEEELKKLEGIEIIKLNKLFISLNKAWARKDMKGIKAYLAIIEREVKW